ncbi:MAG: hypothetical protein J6X03_05230 [Bacilli bacterium]|nr:hypothetical protein [Bacilli bacterium]
MPYSHSSNPALTYSYVPPVSTFRFEGFEESLPDVNNYENGAIICVRDGYNTRFYARLETQWVYLNTALNTQQDEDVLVGYTGYVDEGLPTVSPDFNPVRVTDDLEIVRNDAHFKKMLNNILIELGAINA